MEHTHVEEDTHCSAELKEDAAKTRKIEQESYELVAMAFGRSVLALKASLF